MHAFMLRMQWDMKIYGWVKQIWSFSPKAFFSVIVHFTNWMWFCAGCWTPAAFEWIMQFEPDSAYTAHLNATFPTPHSVLQPLFGSGYPRFSPRQRPGSLCTPSSTTKTKPSVFSLIIIIPTIPLHLIILCSPSPCLLCPPFCKSNSFFHVILPEQHHDKHRPLHLLSSPKASLYRSSIPQPTHP